MSFLPKLTLSSALLASAFLAPSAIAGNQGYTPDALPSHATVGQCYARVKHDAKYATESEIVVVEDAYRHLEVDQPQLASRQEQVLVKEASVRYQVRQPQYRTVTEQILTRPAYQKLSVSAPQFENVTETVQVSAPRVVWKRGNPGALAAQGYNVLTTASGGYSSGSQSSGTYGSGYTQGHSGHSQGYTQTNPHDCGSACEIWCLVEEPGETITYNRKVMTSPGNINRQTVPAKYTPISKQVVADPGGVQQIPVPAEYRSVTVEDIVHPGGERYVDVPAVMGNVAKQVMVAPESYEWMRVICNTGQVIGSAPANFSPPPVQNYSSYVAPAATTSAITYGAVSSSSCNSAAGLGCEPTGLRIAPTRAATSSVTCNSGQCDSSVTAGLPIAPLAPSAGYSYHNNTPTSLSYGSATHGSLYSQTSQPRVYGGDGFNTHHSAR